MTLDDIISMGQTPVVAEKKNPLGEPGETVKHNVKRLRESVGLSYAELARKLDSLGRPIPVLGLSRIEKGERRVDADDLVALAIALDASPIALLMPETVEESEPASLMGKPITAREMWNWLRGDQLPDALEGNALAFVVRSRPRWTINLEMPAPTIEVDGRELK
ncbi:helix-turn-helix transcriptional regulator [Nocardia sp. NPDC049220]|uniref:helix-turn-helix domain-containing protein n=1 Tax=Nocardia sp. NPDC049220 TaxID=3155273 RepID=UPI0033F713F9